MPSNHDASYTALHADMKIANMFVTWDHMDATLGESPFQAYQNLDRRSVKLRNFRMTGSTNTEAHACLGGSP
jgi:hypothetical protein